MMKKALNLILLKLQSDLLISKTLLLSCGAIALKIRHNTEHWKVTEHV